MGSVCLSVSQSVIQSVSQSVSQSVGLQICFLEGKNWNMKTGYVERKKTDYVANFYLRLGNDLISFFEGKNWNMKTGYVDR